MAQKRTGNAKDQNFVNAFVTASLTVCIGAMAVIGSIQDGMYGDHSILISKALMDFIIILVMSASMGKGCAFSAVPVRRREPALRQKNPRRQPSSRSAGCGGVCGAAGVTERDVDVFTSTLQGLLFPIPQSPLHIVPTVKAIRTQII